MKKRLYLLMIGVVLCVAGCASKTEQNIIVVDEVVQSGTEKDVGINPVVVEDSGKIMQFETEYMTEVEPVIVEDMPEVKESTDVSSEPAQGNDYLDKFMQQETVVFEGVEFTLPCEASILTEMGWIPSEAKIVDESKSCIMMHEAYPDNSLNVVASVKNFTGEEQPFENCILFALDVKNSFLGGVLDEYADMSYEGVEFGMSIEEVTGLMGEPNDVTVSEDSVFAEQTGTCTILRYAGLGLGRAVEIWHYDNLGVTRIDVQVITI